MGGRLVPVKPTPTRVLIVPRRLSTDAGPFHSRPGSWTIGSSVVNALSNGGRTSMSHSLGCSRHIMASWTWNILLFVLVVELSVLLVNFLRKSPIFDSLGHASESKSLVLCVMEKRSSVVVRRPCWWFDRRSHRRFI